MGYFEIGVYQPVRAENIGTLWRSAFQMGAAGIFTVGRTYRKQTSDVFHASLNIPMRTYASIEDLLKARPYGALLVGVEMGGTPLSEFSHPDCALYLLGSEDIGLPQRILDLCNHVVAIESVNRASYNVAVAGSLVMYHRQFVDRGASPTGQLPAS